MVRAPILDVASWAALASLNAKQRFPEPAMKLRKVSLPKGHVSFRQASNVAIRNYSIFFSALKRGGQF